MSHHILVRKTLEPNPAWMELPPGHPCYGSKDLRLLAVEGEVHLAHGAPALGIHAFALDQWSVTDVHSGLQLIKSACYADAQRLVAMMLGAYGPGGRWLDEQEALARIRAVCQAYLLGRWLDEPNTYDPNQAKPRPSLIKDLQVSLPTAKPQAVKASLSSPITPQQLRLWLIEHRHALLEEHACVVSYGPLKVVIPQYTYRDSAVLGVKEAVPWLARLEGVSTDELIETIHRAYC
jgi:hypothetical protein